MGVDPPTATHPHISGIACPGQERAWAPDELAGRLAVVAARLVLAPRATQLPAGPESTDAAEPDEPEAASADDAPPPPAPPGEAPSQADAPPEPLRDDPLDDQVLQAATAAIPAGLLARLKAVAAGRPAPSAASRAEASGWT